MNTPVSGRVFAWVALLVALAASIGANVAQARPEAGPRAMAAVAPTLVILASFLLERVALSGARWWQRWLAVGGLIFVVAAAFVTSFQHQYELLMRYGNEPLSAVLLPLAIDALIVMASVCLAVIAEQRRQLAAAVEATAQETDDADTESAEMADTGGQPEQRKRARKRLTVEERVARIYRRDPAVKASDVAIKLREPERTVARHLAKLRQLDEAAPVPVEAVAAP